MSNQHQQEPVDAGFIFFRQAMQLAELAIEQGYIGRCEFFLCGSESKRKPVATKNFNESKCSSVPFHARQPCGCGPWIFFTEEGTEWYLDDFLPSDMRRMTKLMVLGASVHMIEELMAELEYKQDEQLEAGEEVTCIGEELEHLGNLMALSLAWMHEEADVMVKNEVRQRRLADED